jgi:hypothetical protein
MHLTLNQLAEAKKKLREARNREIDGPLQKHHCQVMHIDPATKQPFRLEPKPKGRKAIIEKHFEICYVDGVLHAKIPLGAHGTDHLAIDPATGEIICALCAGGT